MSPPLPGINMDSLDVTNSIQTYWKIFKYIMRDFVTKTDLMAMIGNATVIGTVQGTAGPFSIVGGTSIGNITASLTDLNAQSLGQAYDKAAKTGQAATKETIEGLQAGLG